MEAFLAELRRGGPSARRSSCPERANPSRWISAEEESLYQSAFTGLVAPRRRGSCVRSSRRFLRTHALIGLADLTARYPIPPVEAAELLERWSEEGKVVRVGDPETPDAGTMGGTGKPGRDAPGDRGGATAREPGRCPGGLRRFPAAPAARPSGDAGRRPGVRRGGPGTAPGLRRAGAVWENEILPRRVKGYRPAWLDEVLGQGAWLWRAAGTARDEPRVAFFLRDFDGRPEAEPASAELSADEQKLLEVLDRHGASFATDLARLAGIEPSRVRRALGELMSRGLVTNDRFDPLRAGSHEALRALAEASSSRRAGLSLRMRPRRSLVGTTEGRWSRLADRPATPKPGCLPGPRSCSSVTASSPRGRRPGAVGPVLGRARSALVAVGMARRAAPRLFRRGAFGRPVCVGGGRRRARPARGRRPRDTTLLLYSCLHDRPGQPLRGRSTARHRIARRRGRAAAAARRAISWSSAPAVPILIIESYGKRLTGLASASQADIDSALNLLPGFTGPDRRILKVESYNGEPAAEGPAAGRLAELGFVRDYPGMAYYAGWSDSTRLVMSGRTIADPPELERWRPNLNQPDRSPRRQPSLRLHRDQRPAPGQRRLPGEAARGVPRSGPSSTATSWSSTATSSTT